jgi:hypothetical protein
MPRIFIGDDFEFQNGIIIPYQIISNNFSITKTSGPNSGQCYAIGVDTSSLAITVTLPIGTTSDALSAKVLGRIYYIFDISNNAFANNITINANTNGLIENSNILTLNNNGNSITIICIGLGNDGDGGIWKII